MPKKIVVISAVKNESDIIEAFCRYNLLFADCLLVFENHKSSDNTREIIQKLIDEGLPIYFEAETDMFYETAKGVLAKTAIEKYDADLVIQLDADEFLCHAGGTNPRETLENLDDCVEYNIPWRTYVYENEADTDIGFKPSNFKYYRNPSLEAAQGHAGKALLSRRLMAEKQAAFAPGGHWLEYPQEYQSTAEIRMPPDLICAHYPIRSKQQALSKAVPNWINKWTLPEAERPPHLREHLDTFQIGMLFSDIKKHGDISTEKMKETSIKYSLYNMADKTVIDRLIAELGDDLLLEGPLDTSFCEDAFKPRYEPKADNGKDFMRAILSILDTALQHLDTESRSKSEEIDALTQRCDDLSMQIEQLNNQITEICETKAWKISSKIGRFIRYFVPKRQREK